MLHAVVGKKTRIHRRYIGLKDFQELKVPAEDEITATVLGPLDFMEAGQAFKFWEALLASLGKDGFFPAGDPCEIRMKMWSRTRSLKDGSWVEPDLVVELIWDERQVRTLLVELKWRSGLSGSHQLQRQWLHCLHNEEERARSLHLFIAPDISGGIQALLAEAGNQEYWACPEGSRLLLVPWVHVRGILAMLSKHRTGLGRWAKLSDRFLEQVNIVSFKGFSHLCGKDRGVSEPLSSPIFWVGHDFSGWRGLTDKK